MFSVFLVCANLVLAVHVASNVVPEQVHLAFAGADTKGNPTTVNVAWYTKDVTAGSHVQFGTDPKNLVGDVSSDEPAKQYLVDHGYHHSVTLPKLQAGTTYFYRIGDPSAAWSQIFSFKGPNGETNSFSVSIFGDMGYLGSKERPMVIAKGGLEKNWSAVPTRTRLETLKNAGKYDFMWIVGDIGYADDSFGSEPLKFGYEKVINGYMNWMQNITSSMPLMVSAGNHESECHSPACLANQVYGQGLRNFSAFNTRFHMPSSTSGGVLNMWYSYNYGPVHFVGMNSETDFPGAGEENKGDSGIYPAGHFAADGEYLRWLENDLKQANLSRKDRPWIVAASHRPIKDIDNTNTKIKELFAKYGVDMYFSGHSHKYIRTVPTQNGVHASSNDRSHFHDAQGTTYIVVGGAGCDEMDYVVDPLTKEVTAKPRDSNEQDLVPAGAALTDVETNQYATGILTIHNRSNVEWVLYDSTDGSILDSVSLSKSL
eukprot:CAMPEP_0175140596 /NCGR_PEP_ID=MMETSP0087-20121206/11606_1 /TAXON_ID=136419 /ORGANISM="Unknown Unknown, Strain D1" /LENGTH=484 /DNA_ID=CAMNT_0016423855 /DNA_START=42 /DNA_END=1496 /DNA_ORIENTATION=+